MTDAWWPAMIPTAAASFPNYNLSRWCLEGYLPPFDSLSHENPGVHIQTFLDYCFENQIRIFPHTLHGKAAKWFNALPDQLVQGWENFFNFFRIKFTNPDLPLVFPKCKFCSRPHDLDYFQLFVNAKLERHKEKSKEAPPLIHANDYDQLIKFSSHITKDAIEAPH